jgi:hypothetical protein
VFVTSFANETFPLTWLECTMPVFFDFANAKGLTEEETLLTRPLWCLLPERVSGHAVVLMLSRETFVRRSHAKDHHVPIQEIYESVSHSLLIERLRQKQMAGRQAFRAAQPLIGFERYMARRQRARRRF